MVGKVSERPTHNQMVNLYKDQQKYIETYFKKGNLSEFVRDSVDYRFIPVEFHPNIRAECEKIALIKLVELKDMSIKDKSIDIYKHLIGLGYVVTLFQVYNFVNQRVEHENNTPKV